MLMKLRKPQCEATDLSGYRCVRSQGHKGLHMVKLIQPGGTHRWWFGDEKPSDAWGW